MPSPALPSPARGCGRLLPPHKMAPEAGGEEAGVSPDTRQALPGWEPTALVVGC